MDEGSELENEEPISNSSRIRYTYFRDDTPGKGTHLPFSHV